MKVNPYLSFNGNCAEAVAVYEKAFGVKAVVEMCKEVKNAVVHAEFEIDGNVIMLFDSEGVTIGDNVMITILFDKAEKAKAEKAYDVLAKGGEVIMPLGKTEWSEYFGLLTDKFGVKWNMCQN